jgi:hypothetical protein
MNPMMQTDMHPDAESLTAFAEQSLSGAEREQILAHMAVCGRCREVVFLAQQATDAEEPAQVAVQRIAPEKMSRGWFGGWNWAWVPVAALAGFVGVAVVQHVRQGTSVQQLAQSEQPAEVINGALAAKTANSSEMQKAPKRDEAMVASSVRENVEKPREGVSRKEERATTLDEKKAAEKDESLQAADAVSGAAGGASEAIGGTPVARAKSSGVGGPMAQNQLQQNYSAQQNSLAQGQVNANEMANKPAAPAASAPAARPDSAAQSVEVQSGPKSASASAAQAQAREMATVSVTGQSVDDSRDKVTKQKSVNVKLPNGLGALSVTSAYQLTIAIDTAGALFVSEDAGKHWQSVKAQWTGRAVLVKTLQTNPHLGTRLKQQEPQFELVNDKLQTWVSVDGKTWTEKVLLGK